MFKKQLSLFWVITMYVNGGLIPTFLLYKGLGLTNSFWVYVIPGMVSAFNMLVIRTYMNGIPDSLEESAQLDGAGYTTIFLKIYSPLCKPVYATVALFVVSLPFIRLYNIASNHEFHCPTATNSATVAYTGLQSGEMIFKKIVV